MITGINRRWLIVLSFVTFHVFLFTASAQTIANGSKWWDGSVLYTARVDASGNVKMNGVGQYSDAFRFGLSKVQDVSGRYSLTAEVPETVRGEAGWRVDYIRQEGMNFLAVRKPNNDVVWTLVLTPDNLQNCLGQEKFAEQQPVGETIRDMLLNTTYLGRFSKPQLRLMRNEILARHGWTFQSKDLQEHFGRQSWYHPVPDNNAIRLNIIEQTNVQLIKSEEAVPDNFRSYGADISAYAGGLADDGRGPDEEGVYVVSNENDFIAALGNDRTVVVAENVHLNLSRVLENETLFRNQPGRRWSSDATAIVGKQPLVVSESVFDGRQLVLMNFSGLIIKGEHNASIEVDPRYSYCLYFVNSDHCEVHNLTIGHTEGGYCAGGVIGIRGGRQNMVKDCDLYGCGTYGLDLAETTDFGMLHSNIHDCTYGIMQLRSCVGVRFNSCDFFNNREYDLIGGLGCEGLSFMECRFFANWGDSPLFSLDNTFYMSGCQVYHPTQNLGTIDVADQSGAKNFFSENPFDTNIKSRNIGPK